VVLDPNSEADAGDHSYYDVGHHAVSPDGTRVAWTVDTVGDERYTLVVKHLGLPVVNQGSNIPGESPMSGTPDGSPASTPLQPCIPAVKAVGDAAGSAMLEQGTPISCQTQPGNNSMVLGAPSSEDGSNSSMPGAACDDGNKSTDKVSSHGGEYLVKPGTVHTVGPNLVWSQDGQSVLVMRVTHTTHVPYQVGGWVAAGPLL
jgi:protease II